MRIVVDALAARFGGTAYAAVQVARHLSEEVAVEVVTRRGSIVHRGLEDTGVGLRLLSGRPRHELARRVAWEAAVLPRVARGDALLTWSGMLPRRAGARTVGVLSNPVMLAGAGPADAVRRWAVRMTARHAELVVPSEGMRALVAPLVGPVAVVPHGVDSARFSPAAAPGAEVLCVADFYAHKRHDLLIAAWSRLPAPRPPLRLIGDARVDPQNHARVMRDADRARRLGTITVEHDLPLERLVSAYRAARVLVVASEQESFCLPLLEAQACGVPVVTRDDPALTTAGGPATAYVRGDDPEDWMRAIERLLEDDAAHAAARRDGLAHARTLTWEAAAARLRELLLA